MRKLVFLVALSALFSSIACVSTDDPKITDTNNIKITKDTETQQKDSHKKIIDTTEHTDSSNEDTHSPTCKDGLKNGDESDRDCGGSDCKPCPIGATCRSKWDCISKNCQESTCLKPTCKDKIKNQQETSVDCGGSHCQPCSADKNCNKDRDCKSRVCTNNKCQKSTCSDSTKNQSESDTDCGGKKCRPCISGQKCRKKKDCKSKVCKNNKCKPSTCSDKVKNGSESDVDCGGMKCPSCKSNKNCAKSKDCKSKICKNGTCNKSSCFDKTKNQNEVKIDCGGTCGRLPIFVNIIRGSNKINPNNPIKILSKIKKSDNKSVNLSKHSEKKIGGESIESCIKVKLQKCNYKSTLKIRFKGGPETVIFEKRTNQWKNIFSQLENNSWSSRDIKKTNKTIFLICRGDHNGYLTDSIKIDKFWVK